MADCTKTKIHTELLQWLLQDSSFYISPKISITHDKYGGTSLSSSQSRYLNEKLISVPSRFLLNRKTVTQSILKDSTGCYSLLQHQPGKLKTLSAVSLLCFYILIEWKVVKKSFWMPFFNTLPAWSVFETSVPCIIDICQNKQSSNPWYNNSLLSTASLHHCKRMSSLIQQSWETVQPLVLQTISQSQFQYSCENDLFQDFLHVYMLINSRCLYYELDQKYSEQPEDQFTMVPLVDFINHDSDLQGKNCYPKVNKLSDKFEVFSGETTKHVGELYFHYGAHSNDFLLNEYGFIADSNDSNYIDITPYLIKRFNEKQAECARNTGYYGDYSLSFDNASFRTIVGLCILTSTSESDFEKIDKLIKGILYETSFSYDSLLSTVLKEIRADVESKLETLSKIKVAQISESFLLSALTNNYLQYIEIINSLS